MEQPELFINRELSWLQFNKRVLEEAFDPTTPLYERLKFAAIFASNLDEFYMVRVGSLFDRTLVGGGTDDKTGMTPKEQIAAVNEEVHSLYPLRDRAYWEILAGLSKIAFRHAAFSELDGGDRRIARDFFEREILPVLSPQVIDPRHPFPHLENCQLYIAVRLKAHGGPLYGIIPLTARVRRIFMLPHGRGFLLSEEILLQYTDTVFEGYKLEEKALFRVTRNADIQVDEALFDQDTDYRSIMQELLRRRGRLAPVRLEMTKGADHGLRDFLLARLRLKKEQCFACTAPLDLSFVGDLEPYFEAGVRHRLLFAPMRPQWPAAVSRQDIMGQAEASDILLSFPYDSMRPFIELLREAAEDRRVVSIKITLYRLAQQSQVVQYLCTAAENGKEVTVIVELRARFDEQNNINWSKMLEESGCNVIYGVGEYKVHSKIMLITRRASRGFTYITQIGTGNYNENTARLYTDLSLLTANRQIGEDAVNFFHSLTTGNPGGDYRCLLAAPRSLKSGMLALIAGEHDKAVAGKPARIVAKMNSLTDKEIMEALIAASQAGVQIDLIVRGICCLRPGVTGFSENIRVRSIVGRFLEHSRIYVFGEGESRKVYIASADWMTRNTERRVEIAAPVLDPKIATRLCAVLALQLADNAKARMLGPDGLYTRMGGDRRVDAQTEQYLQACSRAVDEIAAARAPDVRPDGFFSSLFHRRRPPSRGENTE